MPFLAGRGAWPSALSRARSLRLSERSERPLTGEAGGPGAGFQQEGQDRIVSDPGGMNGEKEDAGCPEKFVAVNY